MAPPTAEISMPNRAEIRVSISQLILRGKTLSTSDLNVRTACLALPLPDLAPLKESSNWANDIFMRLNAHQHVAGELYVQFLLLLLLRLRLAFYYTRVWPGASCTSYNVIILS